MGRGNRRVEGVRARFLKLAAGMGWQVQPLRRDHPLMTGKFGAASGNDLTKGMNFQRALRIERLGRPWAELVGIYQDGRLVGVYSPLDVVFSTTGYPAYGCRGYAARRRQGRCRQHPAVPDGPAGKSKRRISNKEHSTPKAEGTAKAAVLAVTWELDIGLFLVGYSLFNRPPDHYLLWPRPPRGYSGNKRDAGPFNQKRCRNPDWHQGLESIA